MRFPTEGFSQLTSQSPIMKRLGYARRRAMVVFVVAGAAAFAGCGVSLSPGDADLDSLSLVAVPNEVGVAQRSSHSELISPDRLPDMDFGEPIVSKAATIPIVRPRRPSSERACLASGQVKITPYVQTASLPSGPLFGLVDRGSGCGAVEPFEMSAADNGRVTFEPAATLQCPMIPALEVWIKNVVKPAAKRHLGARLVGLRVAASYSCRRINSKFHNKMSQHSYANAIDISEFTLADDRVVKVQHGWDGDLSESAFLRAVHRGGCQIFTTVLGPDADRYHHDHFHFDLAKHNASGTYRVCK